MFATVWKYSSLVLNLTTCYTGKDTQDNKRTTGVAGCRIKATEGIVAYINRSTEDVDRHDHLRAIYTVQ